MAALAGEAAVPATDGRLPEPLSEREVLALIAAGGSNQEIVGRLFVPMSTVKTRVYNLYRKLGPRNRARAYSPRRADGSPLAHHWGPRRAPSDPGAGSGHFLRRLSWWRS